MCAVCETHGNLGRVYYSAATASRHAECKLCNHLARNVILLVLGVHGDATDAHVLREFIAVLLQDGLGCAQEILELLLTTGERLRVLREAPRRAWRESVRI